MARNKKGQFVRKSTAAKIRELATAGESTAAIAKKLGVRYQMVRNTLVRSAAQVEVEA